MFAVIFMVHPKAGQFDEYLNLAKLLKPELEKIDGFIDNERSGSQRSEGRVLSLSTWRDEKAVIRWRRRTTSSANAMPDMSGIRMSLIITRNEG
jgi:heme-degrading monooxygenase HmoA